MKIKNIFTTPALLLTMSINAQKKDSVTILKEVIVNEYKTMNGVGHFLNIKDGIIYAGKKNEVILVDSLNANKAINNTRQILGRIPGLNIVETESGGFTANGIASRGLNPNQSIEMNIRQNGYNISADVYGYNEAYYLPPMEAVQRIEFVRGAAALQFGSQFGGLVNYVIAEAPKNHSFQFTTSQTSGSYGLFNTFNSVSGSYKKLSYYTFVQYRALNGFRPNSQQLQLSGFGRIQFTPGKKLNMGIEYSLLRNKIQMPGGLTDSMFAENFRQSARARNWLKSPWNIIATYLNFNPSENTALTIKTTYLFSNRSLVWRNEDGGAGVPDTIDHATNQFIPREVEVENMHNVTTEARLSGNYSLGKTKCTVAGGARIAYACFKRLEGGQGTTGSNYDLAVTGPFENNIDFTTFNVAPFFENIFMIAKHLTITPGIRLEYLKNTANGYVTEDNVKLITNASHTRIFSLSGIGLEFKPAPTNSVYGNISNAFKPVSYSELQPFGVTAKIDPNLKDAYGYNADLGYRATIKNYLNLDVSLFYLNYNNRIGQVIRQYLVTGDSYAYRTNLDQSIHKGVETYAEFNLLKYLNQRSACAISIFNSFAFIDARYTKGVYKGNRVEAAASVIERTGITFGNKLLLSTLQLSYVGDSYGDASNVKVSDNPVAGYIPAFTIADYSGSITFNQYKVRFGVNNILNKAYFTRRTDEYPGPGIIPSPGRSFYLGFTASFRN